LKAIIDVIRPPKSDDADETVDADDDDDDEYETESEEEVEGEDQEDDEDGEGGDTLTWARGLFFVQCFSAELAEKMFNEKFRRKNEQKMPMLKFFGYFTLIF
jgi:hypothetical protein